MLTSDALARACDRVMPVAEALQLSPGPIHFELVPPEAVPVLAANDGLPIRYGHWSFGKSQQRLKTAFDFRLTQIYELVINHVPAYAFIDQRCTPAQALMIVAHVTAHADFFRHHRGFSELARDMVAVASRHRRTIDALRQQFGIQAVESLLDAAHILVEFSGDGLTRNSIGCAADDVLGQIAVYAPRLVDWEREVLSIVWEESRYFWPQRLTRTANEGYATFCHQAMLQQMPLSGDEQWETAYLHAQIVQVTPPQLNPYRLGRLLFEEAYRMGDWAAVWEARDVYDDVGLVRAYFTEAVAERAGLVVYRERDQELLAHREPPDVLQRQLITDLDRAGLPRLVVEDARGGELVLRHHYDGRDLDFGELPFALKAISERIWKGPVLLWTARQGVRHRVRHDGREWSDQAV